MKSHLQVWKFLTPFVLAAVVFFISVDPEQFENYRRGRLFSKQLGEVNFDQAETGILFFGNSLMQEALPPPVVISSRFNRIISKTKSDHKQVRAHRVTVPGLPTIELQKHQAEILALHPKIIILQSELFFPNYPIKNPPKTKRQLLQIKTYQIKRWAIVTRMFFIPSMDKITLPPQTSTLLGAVAGNGGEAKSKKLTKEEIENRQRIMVFWEKREVNKNAPDYLICKRMVDAAHKDGISIAVIDLPLSIRASKTAPPNYLEDRASAIRNLLGPSDFYLRYPEPLPDELFSDYWHLTTRGRAIFFQWMSNKFARESASIL